MNKQTERKKLGLDELEQTQEYQSLTPKQRLFCATYCAGGLLNGVYDPVAATQTAYVCKNAESARVMSYALMSNIRIVEVLNLHFNSEPVEQFIVQLNRAIRNKNLTQAQLWALRLKADIMGFTAKLPVVTDKQPEIPTDVQEATKEARKAQRKAQRKPRESKPRDPSAPKEPSPYGFDN